MVSAFDGNHSSPEGLDEPVPLSMPLSPEEIRALQARNAALEQQVEHLTKELKRKEETHKITEAKLNRILDDADASVVSYCLYADHRCEYEYYLAGCESVFGYTAAEMMDGVWWSRIDPEDQQSVILPARQAIFLEQPVTVEYRFRHKNGDVRWVSSTRTSRRDHTYNCWYVIAVDIDITERKRTEQTLNQYERIVSTSADGIAVINCDFTFRYVNSVWLKWMNKTPEEVINSLFWVVVGRDYFEASARAKLERCFAGETVHFGTWFQISAGNRFFNVTYSPFYEQDGTISGALATTRDLTDLKRVEDALQDSESRFQRIAANVLGIIYQSVSYPNGFNAFTYISPRCREVYGLEPAAIIQDAQLIWSLVHSDDIAALQESIAIALQTQQLWTNEHRIVLSSGEVKWIYGSSRPERQPDGTTIWDGIFLDISDRKRIQAEHEQAEAALRQREQEFRALAEKSPDMISRVDRDFRCRYVNPQLERETGIPCADWIGKTELELGFAPDVVLPWHDLVTLVFETGLPQQFEPAFPALTGVKYWSCRLVPEFDADGTVTSVLTISRDITERRHMELALRASEARNRAILETIPDLLLRVRRGGDCLEQFLPKQANTNVFSIPLQHLSDALPPGAIDIELAAIERALDTGTLQTYELEFTRNEQLVFEEVRVVPLEQTDEVLLMVRDISDRKQTENARNQAEAALQRQLKKEQSLNRVIYAIRNSLELETVFATAVFEIANFLAVDQVSIFQLQSEQRVWRMVAEQMRSPDIPPMLGLEVSDDDTFLGTRLKQLEIIHIEDTCTIDSSDPINQQLAARYPGAWLMIPLAIGNRIWGALVLTQHGRSYHWQNEELALVQAVSDQLAIAIHQSELYQRVTQFNVALERQVEQRTAELQQALEFESLLKRITDKVRDSLDETQILQTAVTELGQALAVACCDAGLYNSDCTTATISYEYSPGMPSALGQTFQISEATHLYKHLLQGEYVQICDLVFITAREVQRQYAMFACPMFDDQGALGDLWLFKRKHEHFNELEIRLVQQVANHCAIALRQSRLYCAIQSHAAELESLNHLKDEFLSTVSHELRTPIANIKMAIQMLEISGVSAASPTDRANRYFQILKDECDRESSLINDLLDLSRLESGLIDLNLTPVRLQNWIPHIAEVFEERTRTQQQYLHYRLAPDLPLFNTDAPYLQRVLTELLHNACKYTPKHEQIIIAADLETQNQPTLTIRVTNTGVVIAEAERDRVFDKFYRISNTDPWKHGGTGLGLALVKKLVDCLGGTIQLECEASATTFTLRFLL